LKSFLFLSKFKENVNFLFLMNIFKVEEAYLYFNKCVSSPFLLSISEVKLLFYSKMYYNSIILVKSFFKRVIFIISLSIKLSKD